MIHRRKTFDCVEEKDRVQRELLAEYEARRSVGLRRSRTQAARKDEFASYGDFIYATADESEEIRAWRERMAGAKRAAEA